MERMEYFHYRMEYFYNKMEYFHFFYMKKNSFITEIQMLSVSLAKY